MHRRDLNPTGGRPGTTFGEGSAAVEKHAVAAAPHGGADAEHSDLVERIGKYSVGITAGESDR
jgi:hypothetical protein